MMKSLARWFNSLNTAQYTLVIVGIVCLAIGLFVENFLFGIAFVTILLSLFLGDDDGEIPPTTKL